MDHNMADDGLVDTNVFGDAQHLAFDDSLFPAGDTSFADAAWGLHASTYTPQVQPQPQQPQPGSRAVSTQNAPSWPQPMPASSNTPTNFHLQANVYGRSPLHSPASFAQNNNNNNNNYAGYSNGNFANYNPQLQYSQQQNILPAYQQQQHQQYNPVSVNPNAVAQHALTPVSQAAVNQTVVNQPPVNQTANPTPVQTPSYSQFPQQLPNRNAAPSQSPADQNALIQAIPASEQSGRFTIHDVPKLIKATNSERFVRFAVMGKQPHEFPVNRSTALPAYVKRNSRSELKRQVKDNPKLQAKLSSRISQNSATNRPTNAASPAQSVYSNDGIKDESDSDTDSNSDISLYSDEEDDLAGAPIPAKRPEDSAKDAVEYDTIKALWRNRRKSVDAASIRKGLGDFWEVVKTIRNRWKTDIQAVEEAEAKERVNDLALLRSRVKDQRDMLEVTIRTALKHGFKSIIELLSENESFLFVCYQFLNDRAKFKDYNGQVSRLILEILTLTTSLTDDKLKKTSLGKILPHYLKHGDGKTKFFAKKVNELAAGNSKTTQAKPSVEPAAGVKRTSATAGNVTTTAPAKKAAIGATAPTAASRSVAAVKKPADVAKASTTPATKTKTVQAKPSGFFSGLQSASKKPGTSNADKSTAKPAQRSSAAPPVKPAFNLAAELANLAKPKEEPKKPEPKPDTTRDNESPERKAKRVARLARGAAGVRWKESQDLVEVRYFSHDPEEELDHDASQMRDVKDVGGEGRMLKQHADMMDVDDEEDSIEDDDSKFAPFRTPSEIDFSTVDQEERDRMFAPYGGGKLQPDSHERAIREQYERDNLLVIYQDPDDIPPNPREPADPYNGDAGGPLKEFGAPPENFVERANQRNAQKAARMSMSMPVNNTSQFQTPPVLGFDVNAFSQMMAAHQAPLPPAQPAASIDLNAIIAQLQPQPAPQPQAPQPMYNYQQQSYQQQQQPQPAAPRPNEPDIGAILAALVNSNTAATPQAPTAAQSPFPHNFPTNFANDQFQQQQPYQQSGENGFGGERKRMPGDNPWYKTKKCKYYQEGKCRKGDDCSYLHE